MAVIRLRCGVHRYYWDSIGVHYLATIWPMDYHHPSLQDPKSVQNGQKIQSTSKDLQHFLRCLAYFALSRQFANTTANDLRCVGHASIWVD